ncbi:E1a [Simian adenovirus 18]|uniref:Early E1A protein n=1 Tax=Simian adenovirus 18 TaxID=909210 RepID=H8PFZ0_9ADEN|nr:E1a [Simian adenovirus 18]AFD10556.1 E1a [Simian adenovirus 18]
MRMLPEIFTGSWEDVFQGLLESEDNFPQPPEPEELPEVSLHDLFDVEVESPDGDPNEEAVDGMFPDWMISQSESAEGSADSGVSGVGNLVEVDLDLKCYEEGFPPSDSETDEASEAEGQEESVCGYVKINEGENLLVLDCPDQPGHGCRACDFHRGTSGNPEAICALCYMRLNEHCIYSPVSDAEGDSESPAGPSQPSPCSLTATPAPDLVRPTPCRVSCRRRAAVNCIEDLLAPDDENAPLNLCLKRPKTS